MKLKDLSGVRFTLVFVTLTVTVALIAHTTRGQGLSRMSVPHDWSHRHVVFSAPSNIWQAWQLQKEPRYWHQLLRRNAEARQGADPDPTGQGRGDKQQDTLRTDWGMSLGAAGTTGAGKFPAKFTFDINAAPDCVNDYVVFNTSLAGSVTQATIVAFNHLYSTQGSVGGLCNQNGPSTMWAYNTGTDPVQTSVVLSLDGTKVAFVGTVGGGATLHILKWSSGQGTITTPVAPDQTIASWGSCTAGNSCVVNLTFNGAQPDTNSSPFYNYSTDTLYVGDNNGVLHKFTPVFTGTPAEVITAPWPITVHSTFTLSGPVFDFGSGNIYVGDSSGQLSYVRETGSSVGTCGSGSPPCLGSTSVTLTGANIVDAPIVDSTAGRVFFFGNDSTTGGIVEQVTTALGTALRVNVGGTIHPGSVIYSGAFDNAYLGGSFTTGHLFVCGKNITNGDRPAIHRIGFASSGNMNTTSDGNLLLVSGNSEACSPVTEIFNGTTDRIFFSVGHNANQTAARCSTTGPIRGCIMSIDLGGSWPPAAVTHGVPVPTNNNGGTSGIIIDNVSGSSQASSIYFTYGANAVTGATCNGATGVGCAVKLTQSALQ